MGTGVKGGSVVSSIFWRFHLLRLSFSVVGVGTNRGAVGNGYIFGEERWVRVMVVMYKK